MLLEGLPAVPGMTLAARYMPAAHDVVGGDWYDVVPLPGGTTAIVIGDVAGHGLSAAAVTAHLRHALRAYLLRDEGPAAALTALHRLMTALLPNDLATVIIAELDLATGALTLANAGHLPALLLHASGGTLIEHPRGPALGLSHAATYPQIDLVLTDDDRLVLYTDGLVESRTTDLDVDIAG